MYYFLSLNQFHEVFEPLLLVPIAFGVLIANFPGGGMGGGGFGGFGGFGDFGYIFGDLFGGGSTRRTNAQNAPRRGENVGARLELTFEEAAFGCEKEVSAQRIENCGSCNGSGSADGVIEAIEHTSLPIFGVQWHPERMCFGKARTDTVDGAKIFEQFIDLCGRSQKD